MKTILLLTTILIFTGCRKDSHYFIKSDWTKICVKEAKQLKGICVSCVTDVLFPKAYASSTAAIAASTSAATAIAASTSAATAAAITNARNKEKERICSDDTTKYEMVCVEYRLVKLEQ